MAMAQSLDLSSIFKAVTGTLVENKADLNQSDEYNHDHGDHMVEIFDLIQKSVSEKKNASPSTQLGYASKQLLEKSSSGSAKAYAQNLSAASKTLKGKQLSTDTIGTLIQSLMGMSGSSQQPQQSAGSDLLGSLLSGLGGAQKSQPQAPSDGGNLLGSLLSGLSGSNQGGSGGDLIGSLLSGMTGQQTEQDNKLDMGDVIKAGMAYYGAKQRGSSNLEAIMSALSSSSTLGQSSHRKKSGALVVNTILDLVKSMKN